MNRRAWIRQNGLVSAGLLISPHVILGGNSTGPDLIIYNFYIYILVSRDQIMFPYQVLLSSSYDAAILLNIYSVYSLLITLNLVNQFLFCFHTKRKMKIDFWHYSDIIQLLFVYLLYLDIAKLNSEDYNSPSEISFFIRAFLLCINNYFVWVRVIGILLTFKQVGPLITMTYQMSIILSKYMILYALYVMCSAAIFSSIFFNYSPNFYNYSDSVFFLIGGFIQNFNMRNFNNYSYFGEILLGLYITFSGILLINLFSF